MQQPQDMALDYHQQRRLDPSQQLSEISSAPLHALHPVHEVNLAGGGPWGELPGDLQRRTWDRRSQPDFDASIFDLPGPLEDEQRDPQGYFTICYSNVGSWLKHGQTLAYQQPDVIVAVETRLADAVWPGQAVAMQRQGYTAAAAPSDKQTNGVPHGGAVIFAKQPCRLAPINLPQDLLQQWPGRVVASRLYPPNAATYMIIVGAYAPFIDRAQQRTEETNRQFLESLFEYLATLDGAPILLAADLNRDAGDPYLAAITTGGRWHDLTTNLLGCRPPTTRTYLPQLGGRAIDHLICNSAALPTFRAMQVAEEAIGHHYPMLLRAHWPEQPQRTLTLQDPCSLPPQAHQPLPQEGAADWAWEDHFEDLANAVAQQDTTSATKWWMRRWEALLHARAEHHGAQIKAGMRERWRLAPPAPMLRGRTSQQSEAEDALGAKLRKLRNLLIEKEARALDGEQLSLDQTRRLYRLIDHCAPLLLQPPGDNPAGGAMDAEGDVNLDGQWQDHHDLLPLVRRVIARREAATRRDRIAQWRRQVGDVRKVGTKKAYAYV